MHGNSNIKYFVEFTWQMMSTWFLYFCGTFRNRGFIDPRSNFAICIVRYLLREVTLTDLSSGEKNMFVNTFKQMEMFNVPFLSIS